MDGREGGRQGVRGGRRWRAPAHTPPLPWAEDNKQPCSNRGMKGRPLTLVPSSTLPCWDYSRVSYFLGKKFHTYRTFFIRDIF